MLDSVKIVVIFNETFLRRIPKFEGKTGPQYNIL